MPIVFNFHEWQYRISLGLSSRLKKIVPATNKFPSASLYIYNLKINAKLQEKTLARWDMSIHHVSTVSCVSLRSQRFVFNVLISCHDRFKATKKSSLHLSWNYQSQLIRVPLFIFHLLWDIFEQVDSILIMTFSVVFWCC